MKPQKYRINIIFQQIGDTKISELIKALICWRLRIWHTTLYRKMDAGVDDHRPERTFMHHEMVTICQVFNELYPFDPPLELEDFYHSSLKRESLRE
ncbi:MAG: hypothetical protein KDE26_16185 [Bacteroidetes bacterium]|nr:hypothetical protein [Bacteroidota bacterium]MCB0844795.1 hypothetical protein [Bacteroidota bacterium]